MQEIEMIKVEENDVPIKETIPNPQPPSFMENPIAIPETRSEQVSSSSISIFHCMKR